MVICESRPKTGWKWLSSFWPAAKAGKRLPVSCEGYILFSRHLRHGFNCNSHASFAGFFSSDPVPRRIAIHGEEPDHSWKNLPCRTRTRYPCIPFATSIYSQRIFLQKAFCARACFTFILRFFHELIFQQIFSNFYH